MFDGWLDVFQVGVKDEMFEVARVRLGERAGEVGIRVKSGYIHKIWLNARADLFAKLEEDLEAAIIHIGPEVDRYFLGNVAEEVADGGRRIAHEADCCMLRGMCNISAEEFVEGGEVFDAED